MASRDMTNGQYTTRPSGDDDEGWDQTDKLEEADKTKRRGNTTTTAENHGKDTDGAQLQDRPFETPGQARNRMTGRLCDQQSDGQTNVGHGRQRRLDKRVDYRANKL